MKAYFQVLDAYFSIILFGPLVTAYWRGTWEIADVYVFPKNPMLSFSVSMISGIVIYFSSVVLQDQFTQINHKMSSVQFYIFSRIHSYILGHAAVNYWRGLMGFMNEIKLTYLSAGTETILATLLLALLKGTCNSISAPLFVQADTGTMGREDYFEITTKFKTKPSASVRFFLDCLYSVIVIIGLVIVQWQGVWGLIDLMISPQDQFQSAWVSVIIGYAMTITLFIVQWPIMFGAKKVKKEDKTCTFYSLIVLEIFLNFCGTTASAFVWRGFWNLQDQLLLTNNKELSVWISHCVGTVCLMIMFHFNTVIQASVGTDGETIFSDEPVFYSISFISNIIKFNMDHKATSSKSMVKEDKSKEINVDMIQSSYL